jgi:hypothetical protein
MTMTPKKYTDRGLITHHQISKGQIIWATGFACRAEQRFTRKKNNNKKNNDKNKEKSTIENG